MILFDYIASDYGPCWRRKMTGEVYNNADTGKQHCANPQCTLSCSWSSCDQTCEASTCTLKCNGSKNCTQFSRSPQGTIECHAEHCDQKCEGSYCSLQCDASNYCIQFCAASICRLKCLAKRCDQTCTESADCEKKTLSRFAASTMETVTTRVSSTTTGYDHSSGFTCPGEWPNQPIILFLRFDLV